MSRPELLFNRDLALAILVATSAPEEQRVWRMERDACRRVLRAMRLPGYLDMDLAAWDARWLTDTLREIQEARREFGDEPENYFDERDFVDFAASRGGR